MGPAAHRRALAVVFVLLSFAAPSAQQAPNWPADVLRDLREAERLLREDKAEAGAAFQALIATTHRLGVEGAEAEAQCGLGQTFLDLGEYGPAEAALKLCLELAERAHSDSGIGRASFYLSRIADTAGRRGEAVAHAERAVAAYGNAHDPSGRAAARLQLIGVARPSPAVLDATMTGVLADARLAGDRLLEASALHDWADNLFTFGRFEEAFDKLTRARDLYHEFGKFADEGTVFNSIGRVYRAHGRLDEALKYQMQALALHEQYGSPFQRMQSHNAVAAVHMLMEHRVEAREEYERALAIARQSGTPRIQDFLNANIAVLLIDSGEYEKGARALEEIVARGLDSYMSQRYATLAFAYVRLGRPADALAAAERSLATCGDDKLGCLRAFKALALAHVATNDAAAAREDVRKALDTIEALRAQLVPADFLKQNFHAAQRDIYSAGIAIAFNQHDDRESLDTAELASSRAFLDLLAARRDGASPAVDGGLTLRGSPPASDDLRSAATAAPAKTDDIVAIARRLHSTAVVYWPADEGLFIWVVNGDGRIASRRVDVSNARLMQLIGATTPFEAGSGGAAAPAHPVATRGAAQISVGARGGQPWRQLYDLLIAPVRDQLPRAPGSLLTIIPHGVLAKVSFAALQNGEGRYLLEDYAIHYAPAAAVLQFTAGMRRVDARKGSALLVADPVTVRRSPLDPALPPLPGAREEVAGIARFIPRSRVTLLEGRDASEPRVAASAASKTIVHFATHAIVQDDQPSESYLAFAAGEGAPTGLLTARDVYNLRLNTDLVVLSACRSGGGRVTGDGVATFARAFIYAGTPSLVLSLWDVADGPTSRLLPAFYQTWLAGASKARSLRRAQLQLLADLRSGKVRVETRAGPIVLPEDPTFWAGFVLIGEPD